MKSKLAHYADDESGAMMMWGLFWTLIFLILGGIAVDATNAWRIRAMLQGTADIAASTAAMNIQDTDQATLKARDIAEENMPSRENGGHVLPTRNIEFGSWDPDAKAFVSGATPPNAVRVTTMRTAANGNQLPTFLLRLVGFDNWQVSGSAIAVAKPTQSCPNGTIIGAGETRTGGGNRLDGVCIHGEMGVIDGGNGYFEPTARLSAPGAGPYIPNVAYNSPSSVEEVGVIDSRQNVVTPLLEPLYDELFANYNGDSDEYEGIFPVEEMLGNPLDGLNIIRIDGSVGTAWADEYYVQGGTWLIRNEAEIQEDTLYIVDGNVIFQGGVQMTKKGVAIVASGNITAGGGHQLRFSNMLLFAGGELTMGGMSSFGYFETGSYCESGLFNTYIFSKTRVQLAGFYSGSGLQGTLVASLGDLNTGGGMNSSGAIYMEADGDVELGGAMSLSGCGTALDTHFDVTLPQFNDTGGTALVY